MAGVEFIEEAAFAGRQAGGEEGGVARCKDEIKLPLSEIKTNLKAVQGGGGVLEGRGSRRKRKTHSFPHRLLKKAGIKATPAV